MTAKIVYLGDLRTEAIHIKSGEILQNDAPIDNNGKGETFSPTDTLSTSLVTCMITIMGILANKEGWDIDGLSAEMVKIMGSNPRRVNEIQIEINFPDGNYDDVKREMLERAAMNCPVAKSLNPELKQKVIFNYPEG